MPEALTAKMKLLINQTLEEISKKVEQHETSQDNSSNLPSCSDVFFCM